MSVTQLSTYIRTIEQRVKIAGFVTKSAKKQLAMASKVFAGRFAKVLDGDV